MPRVFVPGLLSPVEESRILNDEVQKLVKEYASCYNEAHNFGNPGSYTAMNDAADHLVFCVVKECGYKWQPGKYEWLSSDNKIPFCEK